MWGGVAFLVLSSVVMNLCVICALGTLNGNAWPQQSDDFAPGPAADPKDRVVPVMPADTIVQRAVSKSSNLHV